MADQAYCKYSSRNLTKHSGGRYEYTEIWIVPNILNTLSVVGLNDGADQPSNTWQDEAQNAPGLPKIGDINQDGGFVCTSIAPRSMDDQGTAYVDVRWQEDPLTLATEVHYFSQSKTKPAWQGWPAPCDTVPDNNDLTNAFADAPDMTFDVRNSAGDRFNPPVTYQAPMERIEITFHCSLDYHDTGGDSETFEGDWDNYVNHWNKSDFTVTQVDPDNAANNSSRTFPAGSLMFIDKRAPLIKEPFFHRLITCVFLYDPDLWATRVPDMGPRTTAFLKLSGGSLTQQYYDPSGKKATGTVTDCLGRPFGGSAELDGTGKQLLPGQPAVILAWWPIDSVTIGLLNAEFDDLDLFTPERDLNV